MTATEASTEKSNDKVSLPTLTAMVVGSMIGSGVFLLPRRFGTETGVLGAIIAWTIAGAGNADAGLRLSASGDAQARPGRRDLRLCQGGIRGLRRVQLGDRVLGVGMCGQYLLLGAHHGDDERGLSRIRRRGHGARGRGRLVGRRVVVLLPGLAWCQGRRRHQLHRHRRQGRADPGVHRDRDHRVQGRRVRRQLLGRDGVFVLVDMGSGDRHDADHGVRLPGNRGRQCLFPDGPEARGRRARDGHRIPQCAQCFRARDAGVLRRACHRTNWQS